MVAREFKKICLQKGIPEYLIDRYIALTMKETYTEYDIKAVREAAEID